MIPHQELCQALVLNGHNAAEILSTQASIHCSRFVLPTRVLDQEIWGLGLLH